MDTPEKRQHPRDPLHGMTLQKVLEAMVARYGWRGLAERIPIRCFMFDPTVKSSLIFLRKNPWAREKLENWYVGDVRKSQGYGL
jgi:uncharacterized protein (DUF2132 family)